MALDQNNLSMLNYRFSIARSKDLEYRAQAVTIPGMNLGTANQPSPFVPIPRPGNLSYDELVIQFQPGENLGGYLDIFNWMVSLGHPDSLEQYPKSETNVYSDMSVFILNSALRANIQVKFTNAYPTSITPLNFDATLTQTDYQIVTTSFKFERMYFSFIE